MPFLASVKEAKLRSFVAPGTTLSVEAEREHEGSGYVVMRARVLAGDERVCNAVLTFRTVAFPSPEVERHVRERAADTGLLKADG